MKFLIFFLFLALLPLQLSAEGFDSGNQLKRYLKGCTKSSGNSACYVGKGYINGVSDANDRTLCKPDAVTRDQLLVVVYKWLNENPQDLHYIASYNVKKAISEAWPCPDEVAQP
jgi:hypothetical protein